MSLIVRMLKQTAVYWGTPTPDGEGGFTFDAPREIRCRWEPTKELVQDNKGQDVLAKTKVYVGEDVEVNGVLWLGTLDALPVPSNEITAEMLSTLQGAVRVILFKSLANISQTKTLRTALCT